MRKINFYHNSNGKSPVQEFLESLPDKTSKKIAWVMRTVREVNPVPAQYLKKLTNTDDICEIRAIWVPIHSDYYAFSTVVTSSLLLMDLLKRPIKYLKTKLILPKNENVIISGGKNMSDDLERFIEKKKVESPEFAENFEEGYLNFKIGVILRQAREDMGITQQEVADKLNTTKSVISRMENHADDIRLSTLRKYARALGRKVKLEIQ
jgi:DNA-binding XRE family transcriptional regulator